MLLDQQLHLAAVPSLRRGNQGRLLRQEDGRVRLAVGLVAAVGLLSALQRTSLQSVLTSYRSSILQRTRHRRLHQPQGLRLVRLEARGFDRHGCRFSQGELLDLVTFDAYTDSLSQSTY